MVTKHQRGNLPPAKGKRKQDSKELPKLDSKSLFGISRKYWTKETPSDLINITSIREKGLNTHSSNYKY